MSNAIPKTSRARLNMTKYTSRNFAVYADAVNHDLVNDSGDGTGTWRIQVLVTGTLVVRPVNGPADASKDVDLGTPVAGTKFEIQIAMLVSGTAKTLVMW